MDSKSPYIDEYRKIGAKKSLGQNFLTSDAVVENMIKFAEISRDDTILEIGPGLGILSRALIASPADTVILCEKDDKLAAKLKLEITNKRAKIVTQDALILIPSLQAKAPFKVISNLPYNISSPVINSLLTVCPTLPETIIVMLQKEVAERLSSNPGDRNRGILTVLIELFGKTEIIEKVSRDQFYPAPNVDSAVLKISNIIRPKVEIKPFMKMLKLAFAGKRKKIKNSLFATLKIDRNTQIVIEKNTGIDLDLRPEDLSKEDWLKLFEQVSKLLP